MPELRGPGRPWRGLKTSLAGLQTELTLLQEGLLTYSQPPGSPIERETSRGSALRHHCSYLNGVVDARNGGSCEGRRETTPAPVTAGSPPPDTHIPGGNHTRPHHQASGADAIPIPGSQGPFNIWEITPAVTLQTPPPGGGSGPSSQ